MKYYKSFLYVLSLSISLGLFIWLMYVLFWELRLMFYELGYNLEQ